MIKKRFISMLVLLCLTLATGAWAQTETLLTTILSADNTSFTSGSKTFDNKATVTFSGDVRNDGDYFGWFSDEERTLTVTAAEGYTITRVKFYNESGPAFDEQAPFEAILGHVDNYGYITKVNGTSIGYQGVTKIEVYGYGPYKVSLKEGTEDATSWRGKVGEGNYHALPLEDLAAGTTVSVKYSGWKLVKSVKATKEADPPGKPAAQATAEDKGKLIGTDGNIYDDDVAATDAGTTAVAKIVYIGATGHGTYTHGLALALTNEGWNWSWYDAMTACNNKNTSTPVTNATWLLASQAQWDYMLGANGAGSYTALRDGYNLGKSFYWSSTESSSNEACDYDFFHGEWSWSSKSFGHSVRACLAF